MISGDKELEKMEEYNREFNEKLSLRTAIDFRDCDDCNGKGFYEYKIKIMNDCGKLEESSMGRPCDRCGGRMYIIGDKEALKG